jgi:WD40 repeat protein
LLAWGWGKEAVLWDVSTGEQLFSTPIKGEGRGLSSDGCFFAVNNWPTLDIIDMCRGETAFTPPTRFGSAVAFSPNNQLLAYSTTVVPDDSEDTSTWWEFFAIQNLQSGEEVIKEKIIPVEERRSADYEALAFNADGSLVAGANFDEVHVRDFSQGKGTFTAMDLSENGRFLAVSEGQIIHVWNQQTDDLIASVTTALSVDKIQFSTDGKYLATRSRDEYRQGFIEVWNTEDWHSILSIFHSFGDFAFSPDSQVIAVADGSKVAQVLSLPDGQEINSIQHEEKIEQVVFSADGKQLAFRGWWETAGLWYWNASDLIAEACSRLARNLSTDEWQTYVGSEPYHRTCPELRIP